MTYGLGDVRTLESGTLHLGEVGLGDVEREDSSTCYIDDFLFLR